MDRIIRLALTLGFLLAVAACAPAATVISTVALPTVPRPTAPPPTAIALMPAPTAAATNLFLVRPQGDTGPLLAYDMSTGQQRFTLPAGLLSADSQHYLAVTIGADTQLSAFDLATGAAVPVARLTGQWDLSAVSPSGRWAALTRPPTDSDKQAWMAANTWQTAVLVVDTQTGRTVHQFELAGNFAVDTLSPSGDALFVIQYLPAVNPDHYQVRQIDLITDILQDGPLADKRDPEEVMAGQRWQAVAPHDGSWLFTLYLRTTNATAFIHALNTEDKYALCFDLPAVKGSTLDQLRAYTLALAPNGQVIYAANPALGLIATVDLNSYEVARVASFAPDTSTPPSNAPVNYGVADGHGLYFSGGKTIWTFDAATRGVKSLSSLDAVVDGLTLGSGGQRLWVARLGQPPLTLDSASGASLSSQRSQ